MALRYGRYNSVVAVEHTRLVSRQIVGNGLSWRQYLRESPSSATSLRPPLSVIDERGALHHGHASDTRSSLLLFSYACNTSPVVRRHQDLSDDNDVIILFGRSVPIKFLRCLQIQLSSFYATTSRVDNSSSHVMNKYFSFIYDSYVTKTSNLETC